MTKYIVEKEHYKKFGESFVKRYNLEHNVY